MFLVSFSSVHSLSYIVFYLKIVITLIYLYIFVCLSTHAKVCMGTSRPALCLLLPAWGIVGTVGRGTEAGCRLGGSI